MRTLLKIASVAALALLATVGCQSRTDKTDSGGVLLSITRVSPMPYALVVNDSATWSIDEIVVQSIVTDPTGSTSQLMNVELESYEVTYTRLDTGTRVPPVLVEYISGVVPVAGQFTLLNAPYVRLDQINNQPLRDLIQFGVDRETNSAVIRLRVGIRFFGRTLAGRNVESATTFFTIDAFRG